MLLRVSTLPPVRKMILLRRAGKKLSSCSFHKKKNVTIYDCFNAMFTTGTQSCSDFKNEVFLCDLNVEIVPANDDEEGGMVLSGEMEIKEDLNEEYEIELIVWKDGNNGKQFMYNIEGNLCDSLKMEDSPWKPLADALKTTDCPVPVGVYPVDKLKLSLDFAKNVMKREFCTDYVVELCLKKVELNKVACYEIALAITCDCD